MKDVVLHSFGRTVNGTVDGWQPWGSLTPVGTRAGLVIFGRTTYGGPYGDGVIFRMNPNGTDYTILHAFSGTSTGDGANPHHDEMRREGNTLYGTTLVGGKYNQGTIFSINTNGTGYRVLHSFASGSSGDEPHSSPTPVGTVLYGLTASGGASNKGVIYQMNTDGSGYKVLYSFQDATGSEPHGFVSVIGHDLCGMTDLGGNADEGAVFRYNLLTGQYTVLHHFTGGTNDGSFPNHGGLLAVGNTLYGLTDKGGSQYNDGVLFQVDANGTHYKILHAFGKPGDGANPRGSLTLHDNRLYGMTTNGGTAGDGTIFSINVNGSDYKTLYSFRGPIGDGVDGLDNVFISNGILYGMAMEGGPGTSGGSNYPDGIIFALPLTSKKVRSGC